MSWGERARIKELEEQVAKLKAQLRVSGKETFKAGFRRGIMLGSMHFVTAEQAWADYQRGLDSGE